MARTFFKLFNVIYMTPFWVDDVIDMSDNKKIVASVIRVMDCFVVFIDIIEV